MGLHNATFMNLFERNLSFMKAHNCYLLIKICVKGKKKENFIFYFKKTESKTNRELKKTINPITAWNSVSQKYSSRKIRIFLHHPGPNPIPVASVRTL